MIRPDRIEYLAALKAAIFLRYHCDATHRESVYIHESLGQCQMVWEGYVEVFHLSDYKRSKVCYAWCKPKSDGIVITTLLQTRFVESPQRAVQSALFTGLEKPGKINLFVPDQNIERMREPLREESRIFQQDEPAGQQRTDV